MKKTAYLGPAGSYSQLAAQKMRPNDEKIEGKSFLEVASLVLSGKADYAVLPIENTLNGGVTQNVDILQYSDGLVAVQELTLEINHRLIYKKGADIRKITRIFSHAQALAQCSNYLEKHFSGASLIATPSTSGCVALIANDTDAGIVGSQFDVGEFAVLDANIADEKNNYTHFLLVKKGEIASDKSSKKIYFSATCKHQTGALLSLLTTIKDCSFNMTKIESRPIKDKMGEYRFFIEIEGDYSSEQTKKSLEKIKAETSSYKLLGCY